MLFHTLCLLHRNLFYGERRKYIIRLRSTESHHWEEDDLIDRWKALFEVLTVPAGRIHLMRSELPRYHVCMRSRFSPVWLFGTPWTVNSQALLSVGYSRQEYRSGLWFPSLGDLPDPGIELKFPASAGSFFTTVPPGKPIYLLLYNKLFWTSVA